MVTIEVGAEKEHFVVHQSYLCSKSPYFEKALSGSFQEAITRFVRLPDVSPILFRIFVAWLYHGTLSYLPPLGRTITEDLESLEIAEEDLEHNIVHQYQTEDQSNHQKSDSDGSDDDVKETAPSSGMVDDSGNDTAAPPESIEDSTSCVARDIDCLGDDPTTWPYHTLIQLYVLADYFQIRELKADSLDAFIRATDKSTFMLNFSGIQYVYNKTSAGSPLRKFVVHHAQ